MTASTGDAVLRETTWRDIDALAAAEIELFGDDAWSAASWWGELAGRPRRDYVTLVTATAPEQVLGYAGLDHGGAVADVMTIAVAPDARGRGHGGRLLRHLVRAAADHGAEHLMLEVRADNTAARNLYERHGFSTISTRRRYYGDVDAIVMRRTLAPRDAVALESDSTHLTEAR